MEAYFREIGLSHLQDIVAVGEKHIAPVAVDSHKLMFAFLERCERLRVVAFYPAGLVKRDRLPAHGGAIFVEQTILNHLKLKLAYRDDDLASVELIDKQLGHTLVHKLLYAFFKLL